MRASDAWLPALSLVAINSAGVVGHVLCIRACVDSAPVLGLGPLSVHPDHQGHSVGLALMHAVLGAADALDEPLVVLLGDARYYSRFGFRLAEEYGITPPVAEWRPHFQARTSPRSLPRSTGGSATPSHSIGYRRSPRDHTDTPPEPSADAAPTRRGEQLADYPIAPGPVRICGDGGSVAGRSWAARVTFVSWSAGGVGGAPRDSFARSIYGTVLGGLRQDSAHNDQPAQP